MEDTVMEYTITIYLTSKENEFLELLREKENYNSNEVKITPEESEQYSNEITLLVKKGIINYFLRIISITTIGKQIINNK